MNEVCYICHTNYHLLITLVKCNFNKKNTIYLFNKVPNELILKLMKKGLNVIKHNYININYHAFDNIFIYNDNTRIGYYLRKNKINYNLIEDSYNYYYYDIYSIYKYRVSIKRRIFNFLFSKSVPFGYSKYVTSIEVNDKNKVIKDKRYKKMLEVPRKDLFNNISKDRKNFILDVFCVKPMDYLEGKKSILILTQPLYQDNFDKEIISSEMDQINYYKNIIDKYKKKYTIYFKSHPRDNIDYFSLSYDNVIFLQRDVPMELYEFIGSYNFDIGITHSSTALDYLSCVKEKIFLKDLRK